jgi:hypothetical protein
VKQTSFVPETSHTNLASGSAAAGGNNFAMRFDFDNFDTEIYHGSSSSGMAGA